MEKMTKEQVIQELAKDPALDSEQVKYGAEIYENSEDMDFDKLKSITSKFNALQLGVVSDIVTYNKTADFKIDEDILICPLFNATQMQILCEVYKNKEIMNKYPEEVKKLTDHKIPYLKLNYLTKALMAGHKNIVNYIDFDTECVYEIMAGYLDGIDADLYADKTLSQNDMELLRHALIIGADIVINNGRFSINI